MNFLKIIHNMWLGAMILCFLFAIVQYYNIGLDVRILYTIIVFLLCFLVYHKLGKLVEKSGRRSKKFR